MMNLGDYIGDTRTDSLPAGFLKSIKIKYRHEASRVFAGLQPHSRQNVTNEESGSAVEEKARSKEDGREKDDEHKQNSFMNWRVPSRLLNLDGGEKIITDENKRSPNAASARNISERATAQTIRSLSSVSLSSNIKRVDRKQSENKVENKVSQIKETKTRGNGMKIKDGDHSKHSKHDAKQDENDDENNVTTANSKILKPITLKLGKDRIATPKEKSHMPSKTQSHENPLRNFTQRKTEVILDENKVKNDGGLKLPDKVSGKVSEFKLQTTTDTNSKMQEENNHNEDKIRKEGTGIDTKGCTKRFLKETKMKGSMLKYKQNNPQIQVNNSALPTLNAAENRTSVKLSHTPERMDKIFHWIQKSSGKEREVAFNLLSTFSTSEKFQTKTAKKKERVKITLQVLERSKMPNSMEPMQLKTSKRDSTAMRLDHRESYNRLVKQREKEEMKTWHHVPLYHHSNTSNRSALFLQPSKRYQSHFSIHPDWGLHSQARFTKSIKT